jgi:PKD repeat protein
LLIIFTDTSSGSIVNWVWNFGGGSYGYTNSTLVNKADFLLLVSP